MAIIYAMKNSQIKFANQQIALQSEYLNNSRNLYNQYSMAIPPNVLQQSLQFQQRVLMNNMQSQQQILQNNLNFIRQNF